MRQMNRERQRSVVMVLSDLNLAEHYCDLLTAMEDGQVVSCIAPDAVITPELLCDVFEVEGIAVRNPATCTVVVIPVRALSPTDESPSTTKMPLGRPISIEQAAYA